MNDADITGEMAAIDEVTKKPVPEMIVIGLTGGIASGKSTVSRTFKEQGVPVIDADLIAREIVEPGKPALEAVRQVFGPGVLTPEGTLDRKKLGSMIFADKELRAKLDACMEPYLIPLIDHRVEMYRIAGYKLVCLDAPLLVEKELHHRFRPVVVVYCPMTTQVERLMDRNGFSKEEARQRIDSQLPGDERVKVADYVIHTDGTLEQSRARAIGVLHEIKNRQALGLGW
jgi:dephospho-CoA kinase